MNVRQAMEGAAAVRRRGAQRRLALVGLAVAAALGYLVVAGMRGATAYHLTVSELKARGQAAVGESARVAGTVDGACVSRNGGQTVLAFRLRDEVESLAVVHRGAAPATFGDGAEAIVEGRLLADGTFEAKTLMLRCPSRYESGTPLYHNQPGCGR